VLSSVKLRLALLTVLLPHLSAAHLYALSSVSPSEALTSGRTAVRNNRFGTAFSSDSLSQGHQSPGVSTSSTRSDV
jgi:hypothetical protein